MEPCTLAREPSLADLEEMRMSRIAVASEIGGCWGLKLWPSRFRTAWPRVALLTLIAGIFLACGSRTGSSSTGTDAGRPPEDAASSTPDAAPADANEVADASEVHDAADGGALDAAPTLVAAWLAREFDININGHGEGPGPVGDLMDQLDRNAGGDPVGASQLVLTIEDISDGTGRLTLGIAYALVDQPGVYRMLDEPPPVVVEASTHHFDPDVVRYGPTAISAPVFIDLRLDSPDVHLLLTMQPAYPNGEALVDVGGLLTSPLLTLRNFRMTRSMACQITLKGVNLLEWLEGCPGGSVDPQTCTCACCTHSDFDMRMMVNRFDAVQVIK
jgi:hypothetical protein